LGGGASAEDNYPPTTNAKIRTALEFIRMVKEYTLASQFDPDQLTDLLNPQAHLYNPSDDLALKLSLLNFISLIGSSQDAYKDVHRNFQACYPNTETFSYYQAERRARNLSGVVTWEHHMCINSCAGFTGPYAELEHCPGCGEARYKAKDLAESGGERKVPRQVFTTFPVGPQLQACWKHPQTAKDMSYRWEKTEELRREQTASDKPPGIYDDIFCGDAYRNLVDNNLVTEYDTVLMFSIDGAQLYESKQSDCWIYIWIVVDLAPDKRYKIRNILPGGVIPGPERPANLDSFLFPGMAHLSALQSEGLPIWDAYHQRRAVSFLFLLLVLADTIAMTQLSGSVGHHGRKGCRLLCGLVGRQGPKQGPRFALHPDVYALLRIATAHLATAHVVSLR
jgi:hypothetical protein